jgi:pimeloyl-ACP methyl ester carboxylesterase
MSLPKVDFAVHRTEVSPGLFLAYVREGKGGYPLLLVHGFPETKRIWYRNIEPLAKAGFEVIVPDLRGFGDSDLSAEGFYDPMAFSRDLYALVHDVLGHSRCSMVGGDVGGVVAPNLSLTYEGFVERLCIFNTIPPMLNEAYAKAGIPEDEPVERRSVMDYFVRQGSDGDGLAAEMDTPERRRGYIAAFYSHRLWHGHYEFSQEEIDFFTEPFADAKKFRASYGLYECNYGKRPISDMVRFFEPVPVPTLILYGPEDPILDERFMRRCEIAFPDHAGPFLVPGAGHFLQWEKAEVLNNSLRHFLRDRLKS